MHQCRATHGKQPHGATWELGSLGAWELGLQNLIVEHRRLSQKQRVLGHERLAKCEYESSRFFFAVNRAAVKIFSEMPKQVVLPGLTSH